MRLIVANPDRKLGFTLIELMVVIALIGIMTAMILPEMKGTFEDARLRAASRELVNVFGAAYSRAVSVNQVLRVRLDRKSPAALSALRRPCLHARHDGYGPQPWSQ